MQTLISATHWLSLRNKIVQMMTIMKKYRAKDKRNATQMKAEMLCYTATYCNNSNLKSLENNCLLASIS